MNKKDIENYNNTKKQVLTTSEVIRSSFVNVLNQLEIKDFVVVENQRQKKTLIIQNIDTFIGIESSKKAFKGKVTNEEENILLARTFIKENVFFLMKFESQNITFPKIESILANPEKTKNGFDSQITKQLMDSWKYILSSIIPMNINYLLHLHGIIAKEQALEWGVLRSGKVTISGTEHSPEIPNKKLVENLFKEYENSKDRYKAGAILLAKMIKSQLFWDGNKRTAFLTVNKLLIQEGLGILSLNWKDFDKFNQLLNDYYNSEFKLKKLILFIENNCYYNTLDKKLIR